MALVLRRAPQPPTPERLRLRRKTSPPPAEPGDVERAAALIEKRGPDGITTRELAKRLRLSWDAACRVATALWKDGRMQQRWAVCPDHKTHYAYQESRWYPHGVVPSETNVRAMTLRGLHEEAIDSGTSPMPQHQIPKDQPIRRLVWKK